MFVFCMNYICFLALNLPCEYVASVELEITGAAMSPSTPRRGVADPNEQGMRAENQEPAPEKCRIEFAISDAVEYHACQHAPIAQGDARPESSRFDEVQGNPRHSRTPD